MAGPLPCGPLTGPLITDMDTEQHIETTDCPLCSSTRRIVTPYGRGELRVVRCRSCLVYYLSPRLTAERMAELYRDEGYFEGNGFGYASYRRQESSLRKTFRRLVRNLRRRKLTGGALLEVGCGYGYFLDAAYGVFTRRVGTEMSVGAAATARRTGAQVHIGGVNEMPREERFDLVVALHVIEHVYEPVAFVDRLLKQVKEGGPSSLPRQTWEAHGVVCWERPGSPSSIPTRRALRPRDPRRLHGSFPTLVDFRKVPYPHAFPLSEVLDKLGLPAPSVLDRAIVWVPGTTIALVGRRGMT